MAQIRVRKKTTGETGTMPEEKFNAQVYERSDVIPVPVGMNVEDKSIFRQAVPQPEKPSLGGFAKNILKSGWETVKGVGGATLNIFNPDIEKNTIANLLRLGVGTAELAIPGEQGAEKYARSVGQFYDERYGISNLLKGDVTGAVEKTKKTIYEDPVGFALDASIILGGTGIAVKGVGTVGKIEKLTKAGTVLTRVGEIVDPLRVMGGITTKVLKPGEKIAKIGEQVEKFGTRYGLRALKTAPSDVTGFKQLTGDALDAFQKENKLYGSSEQIISKTDDLIKASQEQYNTLVRTGERIDIKGYTKMLRDTAKELKAGNVSPEIAATADSLIERANFMDKAAGKSGKVIMDNLVEAKGQAFSKVTPSTMKDAAAVNANKVAGGLGIEFLEKYASGSEAIGKRLQALREFQRIVVERSAKGGGTQPFNIFRGGTTGGAVGYGVGMMTGQPWLGAITGGILGELANTPRVISKTSQIAQTIGKGIQKAPGLAEQIGGFVVPKAAVVSRLTPPTGLEFAGGETAVPSEAETISSISGMDRTQPQVTTQPSTITGYNLNQHAKALSKAIKARDKKAIADIKADMAVEEDYQKRIGGGTGKPLTGPNAVLLNKAQTAVSAVDRISDSLMDKSGNFQSGKLWSKKLNPLSQEGRRLGADITSAIDILGYFRTGAAITIDQRKDYIYMFPNELDDKETVKWKLFNLKNEFEGYRKGITASGGVLELQFQGGQSAF